MLKKSDKKAKPLFAKNIISRRKALGWNAHELAEEAKIPYPTLRDIEAGYSNGREDTRASIAKALKCSMADLHFEEAKPAIRRPGPRDLQSLIDAPGASLPWGPLSQVLESFANADRALRAHVLALLYEDVSIADEFLSDKKPGSERARKIIA